MQGVINQFMVSSLGTLSNLWEQPKTPRRQGGLLAPCAVGVDVGVDVGVGVGVPEHNDDPDQSPNTSPP